MVDGQGGGIGATLIKRLKEVYREEHEVIALGTNAVATAQMMKARANRGASGENAIVQTVSTADVILGSISIVLANAMMAALNQSFSTQLYVMDETRRHQIVAEIQERLAQELPTLPLYYTTQYYAHDGRVPWFSTAGGIAKGIPVCFNKIALLPGAKELPAP